MPRLRKRLHHLNFPVSKTNLLKLEMHYCEIFGMERKPRPTFVIDNELRDGVWLGFPGDSEAIIHLIVVPSGKRAKKGGALDHFAFQAPASSYKEWCGHLTEHESEHTAIFNKDAGFHQIFVQNPITEVTTEINFDLQEEEKESGLPSC